MLSVVLGMWLLVGCTPMLNRALTVEAAVEQAVAEGIGQQQKLVGGPELRFVRETALGTAALYTLETEHDGARMQHTQVSFLERDGVIWQSTSGSGSGSGGAREPVEFYMSTAERGFAYAYGIVSDPDVRQVRVTFEHQLRQSAEVENGAYLVLANAGRPTRIEALDEQGVVLHQWGT